MPENPARKIADDKPVPTGLLARAVRVIEFTEDVVHVMVWVLLVVIGLLLVFDTSRHISAC